MWKVIWMIEMLLVSCLLQNSNGFVPKTTKTTTSKSLELSSFHNDSGLHGRSLEVWDGKRGGSLLRAWPQARDADPKGMPPDYPLAVARMAVTAGSVVWTWYAAQKLNSVVMASSAVTLVASLVSPGLGQAAFCGTFAGMSAPTLLSNQRAILSLGLITTLLFEILIHYRNILLGIGGRLGFVAFLANNVVALLLTHQPIYSPSTTTTSTVFPIAKAVTTSLYTALGAVMTIVLREASDDRSASDPVRASAVVGLLASLMVGVVFPLSYFNDASSLAIYAGSFVGMSLPSRLIKGILPNDTTSSKATTKLALLSVFALAGALGGLYNVALTHLGLWAVPAGWGGKAGFTSMLGVLTCRLLSKLIKKLSTNNP